MRCGGWWAFCLAGLGLAALMALPAGAGTPSGVQAVASAFAAPKAEGEIRVLFIGNSFTREHDLPAQVARLAAQSGVRLSPGMIVRDGARLADHAAEPDVTGLIGGVAWDVLVLQDHSVVALTPEGAAASRGAVARMAGLTPARLVLFATWPRAAGHALYAEAGMPAGPAQMNARVGAHYAAMAEDLGARVAGVGDAFLTIAARQPEVALHAADGYHASVEGARLAASILAAAILGRPVAPSADRAGLGGPRVQPVRSMVLR